MLRNTLDDRTASVVQAGGAAGSPASARSVRVGVVCDFLEEQWPSMDLVGDELCRSLAAECHGMLTVNQLRPPLRQRLTRFPLLPAKPAWNGDRLLNRFMDYSAWLRSRRDEYDVFHLVDHSYSQLIHALPASRTIVTCHDLDTFRCLLEPALEPRSRWFRAMTGRILDGFRKAAHVITVSGATRDRLLSHALFPPERITVIPNGVSRSYTPQPNPGADAALASLFAGIDGGSPLLLNVGSLSPRKRLDLLLRIFAAVLREIPNLRLIRVGGLTPDLQRLAEELEITSALLIVPFLEREMLAAMYRRAALLVHTAEAEGFGLPLIEALACGCPVVATDLPVLREVAGVAATFCPLANVAAWKDAIVALLSERKLQPHAWQARVRLGVGHSGRYSWAENARQTGLVYQRVMSEQRITA